MSGNSQGVRSRSKKTTNTTNVSSSSKQTVQEANSIKAAQDLLSESGTFSLSIYTAFRVLFIVRCFSALYSILDDCDEVYNYWEPTHYLLEGYGRETWEYSTEYKVRSWAYVLVHALVGFVAKLIAPTKVQVFYIIRLALGGVSSFAEARFYRTITEEISPHVGRYVFVILFFSAGMFNASTAYLPSSFAMYCVFMAFSYILKPVSDIDRTRTFYSVFWIGLGSLAGWPFAALVGIPFALEEILEFGRGTELKEDGTIVHSIAAPNWRLKRFVRLFESVFIIAIGLVFILVLMDQMVYRQYTIVAWNIIKYNMFSNGVGPDLYGTEPWYYYIINGFLNFNIVFLLALASAFCVLISAVIDRNRITGNTKTEQAWPYLKLGLKLIPFYIWFITFSLQAHKEERFMYVAYPLVSLNAAISIYLVRTWASRFAGVLGAQAKTRVIVLRYTSLVILTVFGLLSASRIIALLTHYRAPFEIYSSIWAEQAPDQLVNKNYLREDYPHDLSIKEKNVCIGAEWYRFPSQFFLPSDTRLQFTYGGFHGQLPQVFKEDWTVSNYEVNGENKSYRKRELKWKGARLAPQGFNNANKHNPSVYVDFQDCDYMVELFDKPLEANDNWEILTCNPFLDAKKSHRLFRAFWVPGSHGLEWNHYCMLKLKRSHKL